MSNSSKGNPIQDGIRDPAAYQIWRKLEQAPILKEENRWVETSKGDINIGQLTHHFKMNIADLPKEEQLKLLKIKTEFNRKRNKANVWKKKAFDLKKGKFDKHSPRQRNANRFNHLDGYKDKLLELFGRMFTPKEVHEIAKGEWGLPVTLQTLREFKSFYFKEIDKKVEKFKASYSDVRLGIKRSRLDELSWMYLQAKRKFREHQNQSWLREMRNILKDVKQEVEGDIVINGQLEVSQTLEVYAQKKALDGLALRQIILSRVANKVGLNSDQLIDKLAQSYYSRYSALSGEELERDLNKVNYPSKSEYDFNRIEKMAEKQRKKNEDFEEIEPEITPVSEDKKEDELSVADSIRAKARKKIDDRKEKTDSVKRSIMADIAKFKAKNHKD